MNGTLAEARFIISMTVVISAVAYDVAVTFFQIHLDKELLTVILTGLNANGLVGVIGYWLGSSYGSANKSEQIAQLTNKP